MSNPRDPYITPCPKCGGLAHADFVDIGVGSQQCGPYVCEDIEACGWVQQTEPIDVFDLNEDGEPF